MTKVYHPLSLSPVYHPTGGRFTTRRVARLSRIAPVLFVFDIAAPYVF